MRALQHKDKEKMINKKGGRSGTACSPLLGTYVRTASSPRQPAEPDEKARLVVQRIGALGYHPLGLVVRCSSSRLAGARRRRLSRLKHRAVALPRCSSRRRRYCVRLENSAAAGGGRHQQEQQQQKRHRERVWQWRGASATGASSHGRRRSLARQRVRGTEQAGGLVWLSRGEI